MKTTIILVAVMCIPVLAFSATIYVPDDYPTIQQAIDAAMNGDTIIVKPGTYVENIDFKGKAITLTSEQGPYVTTIDGNNAGTTVKFESGEGVNSVLEGFMVTNGLGGGSYPNYRGGGINCDNASSPTITNNIFKRNSSPTAGGAIACLDYSDAIITNNLITGNSADDGGGIYGDDCFLTILNNTIIGNSAGSFGGGIYGYYVGAVVMNNVIMGNTASYKGGGMAVLESTHTPYPIWDICNNIIADNSAGNKGGAINIQCCFPPPGHNITNNTITRNTAVSGGAIALCLSAYPVITSSILWGNSPPEIHIDSGGGEPDVTYSNVMGGWPGVGNIDEDPLFVDPANGDFHLTFNSPCKDTGDNTAIIELTDFEGDPRIAYGTVDMGADECYTHLYCMGDFLPGGSMVGKLVGQPGTSPVGLFFGSGVLDPPLPTAWGNFYLQSPWLLIPLVPIPGNGILELPATIPATPPAPYDLPMQALIGLNPESLTNLYMLEVR